MSILTTWLTGVDFEDRVRSQGRYLLANTVMPRGFSGGAAVDTEGTLIGICTAEHGSGISCIRDFRDLRPLILKAECMLQREKSDEEERRRQALLVSKSDKKKGKSSSGDTGQASRLRQRNRSCEARVHDGGGSETSEAGKEGIRMPKEGGSVTSRGRVRFFGKSRFLRRVSALQRMSPTQRNVCMWFTSVGVSQRRRRAV